MEANPKPPATATALPGVRAKGTRQGWRTVRPGS